MTLAHKVQETYAQASRTASSGASVEVQALNHVTKLLQSAEIEGHLQHPKAADALHKNLQLWRLFANDIANENNGLPEILRGGILNLAAFVERYSKQARNGSVSLEPLVEINLSIVRGLRAGKA